MGYVDEHLMTGESVVYRTQLHWILFAGPLLVTGFFLLMALSMLASSETRSGAILPLGLAGIAGLLLLARYITYRSSEFAVTNKRVIIKVGLLSQRSVEILLSKIETIGVEQPLLGRMLGFGSITVGGTGGTKEMFHQINSPLDFRRRVQEQTSL